MKKKEILFLILCLFCFLQTGFSSDIIEVMPVTDKIIRLHFLDGSIDYIKTPGLQGAETIYNFPLDVDKATYLKSFRITSAEDLNYTKGQFPLKIGRKTKGAAFSFDASKAYPYVNEHYIYIELPYSLQKNVKYTVELGWLADNINSIDFIYNEFDNRSDAIHVNQIGYVPDAHIKSGYLYHWMGDLGPLNLDEYANNLFYIVDNNTNEIKFTGKINLRKKLETGGPDTEVDSTGPYKNFCGADVYECDFSKFKLPGEYKLVVEHVGCSYPFTIDKDVYREVFYTTCRGLYHQRSGTAHTLSYTEWTKGIDHYPGYNNFKVYYSTFRYIDSGETFKEIISHATNQLMPQAWGGWFDAGDWDRDFVHMIASDYMLLSYEFAPYKFSDNELNIPESKNGIPDIIDEAKWCIDLFRRLKGPTGGICGGIEAEAHPLGGQISENDQLKWYTYAEDPGASFLLAASATQLAYCLDIAGIKDSSAILIDESKTAYKWAMNNLVNDDIEKVKYFKMYASAWLFKYTGDKYYEDEFKKDKQIKETSFTKISYYTHIWGNLPAFVYLTTHQSSMDTDMQQSIKTSFINTVKSDLINSAKKRTCPVASFNMYREQLMGTSTTPIIMPLIVSWQITKDSTFLDYCYSTCDYFLGGNPLNITYVTGLGKYYPNEIMNVNSWLDNIYQTIPGIVPFGYYHYPYEQNSNMPIFSKFSYNTCYPQFKNWPVHELFLENRYSYLTNEYTVWQTQGLAVSGYSFLCDTAKEYTPNSKPQISITIDNLKTEYSGNDTIPVKLKYSDDIRCERIELYDHWHLLAVIKPNETVYKWKNPHAGNIQLYTKVFDNQGAYNFSDTLAFIVKTVNSPPKINISSPKDNSVITTNKNISVQVTATAIDGDIDKVELYDGLIKIGQSATPPYNFNFQPADTGMYIITALATDNKGGKSISSIKLYSRADVNNIESKGVSINQVLVYPNPFSRQICFQFPYKLNGLIDIDFYNLKGQLVFNFASTIMDKTLLLNCPENLLQGIYFYKIYIHSNKEAFATGKLVFEPK